MKEPGSLGPHVFDPCTQGFSYCFVHSKRKEHEHCAVCMRGQSHPIHRVTTDEPVAERLEVAA